MSSNIIKLNDLPKDAKLYEEKFRIEYANEFKKWLYSLNDQTIKDQLQILSDKPTQRDEVKEYWSIHKPRLLKYLSDLEIGLFDWFKSHVFDLPEDAYERIKFSILDDSVEIKYSYPYTIIKKDKDKNDIEESRTSTDIIKIRMRNSFELRYEMKQNPEYVPSQKDYEITFSSYETRLDSDKDMCYLMMIGQIAKHNLYNISNDSVFLKVRDSIIEWSDASSLARKESPKYESSNHQIRNSIRDRIVGMVMDEEILSLPVCRVDRWEESGLYGEYNTFKIVIDKILTKTKNINIIYHVDANRLEEGGRNCRTLDIPNSVIPYKISEDDLKGIIGSSIDSIIPYDMESPLVHSIYKDENYNKYEIAD